MTPLAACGIVPLPSRRFEPMSLVRLVLNILWILTGGLWMAAAWVIAGVLLALTIIGLPWARAALNIAAYTLLPFGYRVVRRDEYTGRTDLGTGAPGFLGNLIWWCWRAGGSRWATWLPPWPSRLP
jgi:uncharacterized membrane protein YccF (DUF307 family)